MHHPLSSGTFNSSVGFLAWSPHQTRERKKNGGKINNYYKLLTSLINSNYTRDRSSFKSLSLRSLRCIYLNKCVNEIWNIVCTGACVNMSVAWMIRPRRLKDWILYQFGVCVCVVYFFVHFIWIEWRWNRNRLIENLKELGVNQKTKTFGTAPNFVIPFRWYSCFF